MIPIGEIDSPEVARMAADAQGFLQSHRWCGEVIAGRLGFALAGIIGVFQFELVPTRRGVDDCLWVVVGDLPPAYLVCDDAPTWQGALAGYADEMRRWISAVRCGSDLAEVIPVNAPPNEEHATLLEDRLGFIEANLIKVSPDSIESDV